MATPFLQDVTTVHRSIMSANPSMHNGGAKSNMPPGIQLRGGHLLSTSGGNLGGDETKLYANSQFPSLVNILQRPSVVGVIRRQTQKCYAASPSVGPLSNMMTPSSLASVPAYLVRWQARSRMLPPKTTPATGPSAGDRSLEPQTTPQTSEHVDKLSRLLDNIEVEQPVANYASLTLADVIEPTVFYNERKAAARRLQRSLQRRARIRRRRHTGEPIGKPRHVMVAPRMAPRRTISHSDESHPPQNITIDDLLATLQQPQYTSNELCTVPPPPSISYMTEAMPSFPFGQFNQSPYVYGDEQPNSVGSSTASSSSTTTQYNSTVGSSSSGGEDWNDIQAFMAVDWAHTEL